MIAKLCTKNLFGAMLFLSCAVIFPACTKQEEKRFPDNSALDPGSVPTVKIENYVNRLYIDFLGRVPTIVEMNTEVSLMKSKKLSRAAREDLIFRLQNDTTPVPGEGSYKQAYYQRIYDMVKARLCEGAADGEFTRYAGLAQFSLNVARLNGDSIGVFQALEQIERHLKVVESRIHYRDGTIGINEMFSRMLDNSVYDIINMNTFNFVRASFDDLFYRFPTQAEFESAFGIIETNKMGKILGGYASNKREYCVTLTSSREFYEGIIKWTYLNLIGREPTTEETYTHFEHYYATNDLQYLQRKIAVLDEYANF
jgi:hypothetical protein